MGTRSSSVRSDGMLARLTILLGAKSGANDTRHQATPGHIQPELPQVNGMQSNIWPHSATVRACMACKRSGVRISLAPQARGTLRSCEDRLGGKLGAKVLGSGHGSARVPRGHDLLRPLRRLPRHAAPQGLRNAPASLALVAGCDDRSIGLAAGRYMPVVGDEPTRGSARRSGGLLMVDLLVVERSDWRQETRTALMNAAETSGSARERTPHASPLTRAVPSRCPLRATHGIPAAHPHLQKRLRPSDP